MKKNIEKLKNIEPIFLVIFIMIVILGLTILQTASSISSYKLTGNLYYHLLQQIQKGILPGSILFFIVSMINYKYYKKYYIYLIIFFVSVLINLALLIPALGNTVNGAQRWLDIGIIRIQPSEIMKISIILLVSGYLSNVKEKINDWGNLIRYVMLMGVVVFLVAYLQSNLSTALVLIVTSGSILFQSKIKIDKIIILILTLIIVVFIAISSTPYRISRVKTYLSNNEDVQNQDYHSYQNLISIGSGGTLGVGWNQSRQKFMYVPEVLGDSIFSIYAEEAGFIGVVFLLGLYLAIIQRMYSILLKTDDIFGKYILIGVITWFVVQILLNIGSNIKLIPLTGMTLPFVSFGSSSIIISFILFGIVANISKYRKS